MIQRILATFVVLVLSHSIAMTNSEERGFVRSPMAVQNGIAFTDNYGSALYLLTDDGAIRHLASSPGAGTYYSVSRDKKTIGFKRIDGNGLQTPATIDAATGAVRYLAAPSRSAGQVSFTDDGRLAFTVGNALVVTDGITEMRIGLGTYANIAPVSPDGRRAVFNDDGDRLWMVDLTTRSKTLITGGTCGCFCPQWSADSKKILYSSLNGFLYVYDPATTATAALGEGYAASWSADGREVAFYKKEIRGDSLVNTDIYLADADGRSVRQVTFTPDLCEMDPSFGRSASELLYQTYSRSEVGAMTVPDASAPQGIRSLPRLYQVRVQPKLSSLRPTDAAVRSLDVPYINQVYDTPDWFNGRSACGPTTAMMALAYFNILPAWETNCSTPAYHINNWGKYISEVYTFRNISYSASANDPNKRPAQGAFGYMWSYGSPYSMMSQYYANHGMSSTTAESPSHAAAIAELAAGNPYSICNGLTTAGHIVLAHGFDPAQTSTLIVNDPYGNKNKPGYPNNYGKDARYDWPGYSNGNQNFNTVYWASTVHYPPPAQADSIVDDLQFGKGFYLNTKAPSTMALWKDKNVGYKNHFWYMMTTYSKDTDTCYAVWTPVLGNDGLYEVYAYIPYFDSRYASGVKYKVFSRAGLQTVVVDQGAISRAITKDSLVSLGTFEFGKGSGGYVRVGDATGTKNEPILIDAMVWKYRGSAVTSVGGAGAVPERFALEQNFPNPFNPSTTINFSIPAGTRGHASLRVFDVLGREIAELVNTEMPAGPHSVRWDASAVPGGVYFYRLTVGRAAAGAAQGYTEVKKMSYIK